jgi:hypothetical protein
VAQNNALLLDNNSTIFAYPYNSGSNDPAVVNTVARYYNIGRSGTAPLMFLNCFGFNKHPRKKLIAGPMDPMES